ncbi:hypothetical protein OG984_23530 [Nocardioides sp. NBC_00368]|uniref:hypothetical protein n=1 Tax=Nocardioides sp. NBC_00368 TaxID=2976000 RepID=UPI002E1BFB40
MRTENDTTADPLEIANRALEGLSPATESWIDSPRTNAAPERVRPRHTPYTPPPQPGTALVPVQPAPVPVRYQPPRPSYQRPMPPHSRLPQYAYQPSPYTAQQFHPAGPVTFANPAMPPYAAAQVPTRNAAVEEYRIPKNRARNKKAVLLPLAAMAIASAGIGAFAQSNVGNGLEAETQQVKAHAGEYDAIAVVDTGEQKVIDAPGVIAPEETSLFSRNAGRGTPGKHSSGDYDAPSSADSYGGAHSASGSISTPRDGTVLEDEQPKPAPQPAPEPAPEPNPEPEPAPEPAPTPAPAPPSIGENVVAPVLDTVTGVIDGLTGIQLDLTP